MNSSTPLPRHRILSEGKVEVVLHLPEGLGTGPLASPPCGFVLGSAHAEDAPAARLLVGQES